MERNKHMNANEHVDQKLYTRAQVAKMLCLSERTVFTLDKIGKLPSLRIGRSVRYSSAQIDRFVHDEQIDSQATDTQ